MKTKQLSSVGQALADAKDDFDLAFDKIKDLVLEAGQLPPFKEDDGVLVYRKLVLGTLKRKDRDEQRGQVKTHVGPYAKMYAAFREQILQKDLTWLKENDVNVTTGKSKSACLPLSAVYSYCLRKNEERLDSIEAHLFFIFKYVCDEKADPDGRKMLTSICAEYDVEEDDSAKRAISSVTKKVSELTRGRQTGSSPDDMAKIVTALLGDGSATSGMGALAEGLMSGRMTIPDLIGQVKEAVKDQESDQSNSSDPQKENETQDE